MVCSILLAIVCIVVIILSEGWIQSLFATLLGGALGSIVWLISVIVTDDINYRINQIDNVILQIDKLIANLHIFNHYFVDGMTIINIDANNLIYRLCNLLQTVTYPYLICRGLDYCGFQRLRMIHAYHKFN